MTFITKILPDWLVFPDNPLAKFLRKKIISNSLVDLDYWSIIHALGGVLIAVYIEWFRDKITEYTGFSMHVNVLAFLIILLFELVEFGTTNSLILPESGLNIIWDVIVSYGAYLIARAFIFKMQVI